MRKKLILVIDDEKDVCKVVREGLERLGDFRIIEAYDGQSGIDAAKRLNPDLVLLDIDMPFIDGLKVLQVLKEDVDTFAIPVAMLTGINDRVSKVAAARSYSEDYITKPISVTDLKIRIDNILQRFAF